MNTLSIEHSRLKLLINNFILLSCGFIVFSPISSNICLDLLKFPISLPELLFIPFFFRLRKLLNLKPNKQILLWGIIIIIILTSIALILQTFPVYSILSTVRGYFYMLITFSTFKNKKLPNISIIFLIVLGASFGWMVQGIIAFKQIVLHTYTGSFAVYGNIIALGLMIAISIIFKKKYLIYVGLFITLTISITSAIRRQVSVSFFAYVLSLLSQIKLKNKRIFSSLSFLIFSSIVIVLLFPLAENFTYEISPMLHYRLFVKSEQLISGETNESDKLRVDAFDDFLNNINEYLFPKGFVSKRTLEDTEAGLYMDSPYLELFHTFGIFLSVPLVIYFFKYFIFHIKYYYKKDIRESAVCVILSILIMVLMMIEGSFLNFTYSTPVTGFVFARIFSSYNLIG